MFTISNSCLTVSIIDPVKDRMHLGSRYCTGGYIWQVYDVHNGRPLFSGPRFPSPEPPQFEGQGAPEAFVLPLGEDQGEAGGSVIVPGVGRVIRSVTTLPFSARENPVVDEFCTWSVEHGDTSVTMRTSQKNGDCSCLLKRTVLLEDNHLLSETVLTNESDTSLKVRWFPHPFFLLNKNLNCCNFGIPWIMPENPAYRKTGDGTITMREDYDWIKGLFIKLGIESGLRVSAHVYQPEGRTVEIETDYLLDELPFWANSHTFSPEPYLMRVIPSGESSKWSIRYTFKNSE